jgi:gentisate 1,2-dioxygenase
VYDAALTFNGKGAQMPMVAARSRSSNRDVEFAALHERTRALHLYEFWSIGAGGEHRAVADLQRFTKAIPHIWKYRDVLPCLEKAAELIDMHDSERRSLIMVNPALAGLVATTTTMFAAYRINNPNEIAPAHRHSPNAIRFGLTGHTNFTGVEGEPITFGPGDLVLTPHDTWHNHGNDGEGGAVNLSVLDMPLVNVLNATYFESDYFEEEGGRAVRKDTQTARFAADYSERVYGKGGLLPRTVSHHRGTGNASPMYVYRWEATRELLHGLRDTEGSPYDGVMVEYVDPTTGRPPYATMTFFAEMLRPGERTLPSRQNASLIYTVFEGTGHSMIGGKRFDWEPFDTFCVPGGEWCEHVNATPNGEAILFVSSDEPVLKSLRFYMRHGRTRSGDEVLLSSKADPATER